MAGEKITQNAETGAQGLKSPLVVKPSEKDMALKENVKAGDSAPPHVSSLENAPSGIKGGFDQSSVADQSVYYTPASSYNYYYSAYGGGYTQLDDQSYLNAGGGSYTGVQSDNSLLYYLPGYNPYATGYMGVDGEQPYVSSGYLQQPVSYGSEALPSHPWDLKSAGDVTNMVVNKSDSLKPMGGRNGSAKFNGFNSSKTNNPSLTKASNVPLNSKTRQSALPSNFSKSFDQTQPLKPLNKFCSGLHSMENINGFHHAGKFSPFSNHNQGVFMHYPMNYQPNARMWNGNQRFKPRQNFRREGEIEELTRGPRASTKVDASKLSGEGQHPDKTIQSDKYNLEGFQSEYEKAKFFVIKSYSEDDVHKCVKYDVWSSTPNGNRKLDDAFCDAETKAIESGSKYPVFLFFSVNGSGQFVGVAEMIGRVDFNKNMDFWQLDKWNGFFPVKWHIVKDLPNNLLRHIILENNENRPVTYSRDTQEIGQKQGLEMLKIFKSYSAKTSLLGDFNFYENREKLLIANRGPKPNSQSDVFKHVEIAKNIQGGEKKADENSKAHGINSVPSLVTLTKNLSLNSQPLETNA